uniref:Uncharacterized protein n=1 Tax=Ciona intestinalis TaxID=7719 RepID=H2XUI2_CIOIN
MAFTSKYSLHLLAWFLNEIKMNNAIFIFKQIFNSYCSKGVYAENRY